MRKGYVETECSRCKVRWEISKYNLAKKKTALCSKCVYEVRTMWDTEDKVALSARYSAMIQRCYNPNHPNYDKYGGRGVTVCDEWKNDKMKYVEWCFANGYKKELHLDKDILSKTLEINPPEYSPETCMFVEAGGNMQTTTASRMITFNDKTQNMSQWAREVGIEFKTLQARIDKFGFSIEEALTKPTGKRYGASNNKAVMQYTKGMEFIAEYPTASEADRVTGISYKNISNAVRDKSKSAGGFIWKYKNSTLGGVTNEHFSKHR